MNSLIPNVPTHEIILLPNPPQNLSKNEYITKINKLVEKDTEYRKLLCDVYTQAFGYPSERDKYLSMVKKINSDINQNIAIINNYKSSLSLLGGSKRKSHKSKRKSHKSKRKSHKSKRNRIKNKNKYIFGSTFSKG